MSLDRAQLQAQDILHNIKQKGTDAVRATTELIYTAEAQLKNATLQDLVNRGKVAAWGALGLLDDAAQTTPSRDVLYQHRLRGVHRTRRIVEQIDKEFTGLVADTAALGVRFGKLCTLLNSFRNCCDVHILLSVEEEQELALKEAANGGFVDVDLESEARSLEKSLAERHDDQRIEEFQAKMKRMIAELRETVDTNCKGICHATLADLDRTHHHVVHTVTQAETAADLQRHKVDSAKKAVKKLRDEINAFPDGTRNKSLRVMQLEQTEANLANKVDENNSLQQECQHSVLEGRSKLHFSLEQCSMSTWSMYNIFFSQMTNFFDEASKESSTVSKAFASLKNMQGVSKRITEEKRQRLANAEGQRPPTPPPPSAPRASVEQQQQQSSLLDMVEEQSSSVGTSATAPPADSTVKSRLAASDDDFESFMTQRHGSMSNENASPHSHATQQRSTTTTTTSPQQHTDVWNDLFS
ncbi:Hypothetical protein, putative [Bodo saltans]|uniref:Uncharacterized protein n=1 Tax=Bodo saltans TaxID=75058 RepID=A0A0S4K0W0_BODSA|nr:Hypothetical protein, putative [Bodo saltans]|eukprot:CUG94459.1 Hypothetical protein, putative [Bodo saltans]